MKEHIVHGCNDCPLCVEYYTNNCWCAHPIADKGANDGEIECSRLHGQITPDWCPLKQEPLTIKYANGETCEG